MKDSFNLWPNNDLYVFKFDVELVYFYAFYSEGVGNNEKFGRKV